MNLRTYRARTMGDCLAEVKKDLGKDAVILHTRSYKVGGVLGIGAKPMVEVTASDGSNTPPRRKSGNIAALKAYTAQPALDLGALKPDPDRAARNAAAKNERATPEPAPVAIQEPPEPPVIVTLAQRMPVVRTGGTIEEASVPTVRAAAQNSVSVASGVALASPAAAQSDRGLTDEIASLKRMVGQVLQCSRQTAVRISRDSTHGFTPSSLPDPLVQLYIQMLESDLEAELADEVMVRVRAELSARTLEAGDTATIRDAFIRALCGLIAAEPPTDFASSRSTDGRPLTLALVGPTGVGKTTTIAKLAATFKLRHGRRVGLITSDTYRIAAVDQLRTYAEIIGLPLKVAMSPADMASCCQSLDDCDVVLVDTAGRSPRDAGRLDELRRFIAAAEPHETHLVLSSVSSRSVMLEAAGRFMPIRPDRLIFTKLDEAVSHGTLFSVARRVDLRLSYITTGQEVPDHIEPARPERLAELLLAEKGPAT